VTDEPAQPDSPVRPPAEASAALRDVAPVIAAAIPIAMLFGAVATARGLSVLETGAMSLIVFAGGAQFAALELWSRPVPVAALVFSTLLINARHVLMGTSLAPKLRGFAFWQRLLGMFLLVDETWALAERRAVTRPVTPAYWFGMGCVMGAVWVVFGLAGAILGALIGDPRSIGADFVFSALFIGLIAGLWRGRSTAITVLASGVAAALAYHFAGPPWHVAAGAFAGIAAAYLASAPEPR
jgi:4-azaleucine resistance transporter AzlC